MLFTDRVRHALARRERHDAVLAVMFVDMDDFKTVNESLGHDAGDQVLTTVAARLQLYLREGDSVARFGGRTLRLDTVAEGIEEPQQAARLLQLACRLGQGYLFARPLDRAAAEEFLDAAVREQRVISASRV